MIYVYAVTDAGRALPSDVLGMHEAPIMLRSVGPLTAAYSEHRPQPFAPAADSLWRHERVVETLLRDGETDADVAVLPVRFGMTLGDVDALDDALSRHATALTAGLDRVRGCVEMSVRATRRAGLGQPSMQPVSSGDAERSGRAYMLARLNDERRRRDHEAEAQRVSDALQAKIGDIARGTATRIAPDARVLLTAAYLIAGDEVDTFTARVRTLAATFPELRLTCTGPWPPYHFAPPLNAVGAAHA